MHTPKSQIEVFNYLKPLVPAMDKFKQDNDGSLRADQIHLIKEVYPDIQVFCNGCLSRVFNVNCSSCVREVFEILISFYDRLARNPDINPKAEDKPLLAYMAEEAKKLENQDNDDDYLSKEEAASLALMSEQEEDTLLHLLGLTKENTPDEYLLALWQFVNHDENLAQLPESWHVKLAKKLEDLLMSEDISPEVRLNIITEYAATLPNDDEERKQLEVMADSVSKAYAEAKSKEIVTQVDPEINDDDKALAEAAKTTDTETKDEVINEERDGKPLSSDANIPLNTVDTRTKWQKTADTKKANAAKKAEEAAKLKK